jgi:uncharacterized protein YeaO (DUF488 family)
MTKEQVNADLCLKEAGPCPALRKWFGHDRGKWEAFKKRYFLELDARQDTITILVGKAAQGRFTLLYSARDTECNQAVALRDYLLAQSRKGTHASGRDQP